MPSSQAIEITGICSPAVWKPAVLWLNLQVGPAATRRARAVRCICSAAKNFYGGHGIVAAQVPIGAGIGFAHKYNGTDLVSVTYLGDGAINQGQVGEALNMAELWKLPVIFVIENNKYAMGTSQERASAGTDLYNRGKPYGIPGKQVDGMDVLAVREASDIAVAHCRAGKGRTFSRCRPIGTADIRCQIRPSIEAEKRSARSVRNVTRLIECGFGCLMKEVADEDELKEMDRNIKDIVSDAAEFAQNSPEPDPSELYTDVMVET